RGDIAGAQRSPQPVARHRFACQATAGSSDRDPDSGRHLPFAGKGTFDPAALSAHGRRVREVTRRSFAQPPHQSAFLPPSILSLGTIAARALFSTSSGAFRSRVIKAVNSSPVIG